MKSNEFFVNDFGSFLPEIFLSLCIMYLLLHGSFQVALAASLHTTLISSASRLCLLSLFLTFLLVLNTYSCNCPKGVWAYNFVVDSLSKTSKLIVLFNLGLCVVLSTPYIISSRLRSFEVFVFFLGCCLASFLLISSYSLISLYLSMELLSLMFYILACLKRESGFAAESALKYFILGALASSFFLLGSSFIYLGSGSIDYQSLLLLLSTERKKPLILCVGFTLIVCSLLFKIGSAPYHMWVVDVYEGIPSMTALLFAVVPKFVFSVVLGRLIFGVSPWMFVDLWESLLLLCGCFSLFVGCLGGLGELKLKRLLAYSSIGHVGFVCVGFATGFGHGVQSVFFYLLIYSLTSVYLWAFVISLLPENKKSIHLNDFVGLVRSNPYFALITALMIFSLAGIPPFAGFFSKMFVFFSLVDSSLYLVSLFAVLSSVVSTFYYIRVVKILYFEKPKAWAFFCYLPKSRSCVLNLTAYLVLGFGLMPNLFLLLPMSMCSHIISL